MAREEELQKFRSRITCSCYMAIGQLDKLKAILDRLDRKEDILLEQVTSCIAKRELERAKIIANEVSTVRKLRLRTRQTGTLLEAAVIRLSTLADYANLIDTMAPVVGILNEIDRDLRIVPAMADATLSEMGNIMTDMLSVSNMDATVKNAKTLLHVPIDDGTMSVLKQAEDRIEQEARAKLPEAPSEDNRLAVTTKAKAKQSKDEVLA